MNCTAFAGISRIATGSLEEVALTTKSVIDGGSSEIILIFDDATGRPVDLDFRGTPEEVVRRLAPPPRGPGRPKLGVVAREVTLLPRHWDWLNSQPGGASVALRKLVEQARKSNEEADRVRLAREAAYRFMMAMAGDRPGFEEASRALFAGDQARLESLCAAWPEDIRGHLLNLLK